MKVFIAGPRAVSKLNDSVTERLQSIHNKGFTVLVGDANGVDALIQKYYSSLNYKNVIVFAGKGIARNNIGNWAIENVPVDKKAKGFDFYVQKDIAMAKSADYGFMIWNGKSRGTLNNIINLISENKKALIYLIPHDMFITVNSKAELEYLISMCPVGTKEIYSKLINNSPLEKQVSFLNESPSKFM